MSGIAVSPPAGSGTNLFAATDGGGVFLSTNNGTNWTAANTGLKQTTVWSLAVSPNGAGGSNVFAGTGGGVFLSTNNGTSWAAVDTGLTDNTIYALAVSGTNLFAGSFEGTVWLRPLAQMVTSVNSLSSGVPTHFRLQQNYPNPFNPSTTITFDLPSRSFVSLKVFDALGREIANLVADELAAGTYIRQWNAAALSSGVYYYRLLARDVSGQPAVGLAGGHSGEYVETRRMILLK